MTYETETGALFLRPVTDLLTTRAQTEAMTRCRSTAMLFIILMIIGTILPAAAMVPGHTPVPIPTVNMPANGTHPLEPKPGTTLTFVSPAAGSPPLESANETTALDMLGLVTPAHMRRAYGRARELLRVALIHHALHPRPKSKPQTGRGTSAAATDRRSWMQASRLNTVEHCPFAHFEKAKSIGNPHARERAGRELPPDIERAI